MSVRALWRSLCRIGSPVGAILIVLVAGACVIALLVGGIELVGRTQAALESVDSTTQCADAAGAGPRARGTLPKGRVTLTPRAKVVTWAFDASRTPVAVPIVITASPPLTGLSPVAVEIIPQPLLRADNHLRLPNDLTYTAPTISRNGEQISFEVCLDPKKAEAGRYFGSLYINAGLPNVSGTSVDIVATARSPGWFSLGVLFMLVAIVAVLTMKGVADYRRAIAGTKTNGADTEFRLGEALSYIWRWQDLRLISSLVGVWTAIFVGLRVYNTDRTWGDDAYQDSIALVAAAIAAVGAQGIFDGFLGAAKGPRL